ncbi:helix-turn-helix transcriptional regulator [Gracilibacillus salitolerans]|uniref:helix-turn-helix transcriptional regulator n=1 Tax=Gracilibacillus salitolerans TaxID=2663022 RepID=UPI001891DBB6|nr:helix-turn-helix transcriptional regulator [Gracilibacillus salitolerans]
MAQQDHIDGVLLGYCIRQFRENLKAKDPKWTQEYVGRKAEIDERHYGKIERGKYPQTSFITIGKIAKALNCSLDNLFENYEKELIAYKRRTGEVDEE